MQRNLKLLAAYKAARDALFWLPVFFLFLSSKVTIAEVLWLEAIYYVGVVALEVPSGYFSDRIGRRITLCIAGLATTAAHVVFFVGDDFATLALAQILLAGGMAFNSGTDSALLYDSLDALDRPARFGDEMAKMQGLAFAATAVAALVGGLSASWDLRFPYALSALAAAVSVGCAVGLREPPRRANAAATPLRQVGEVVARVRRPRLAWVFAFAVGMTIFNHVPYELVQPYVRLVLEGAGHDVELTPAAMGAIACVTLVVASVASRRAPGLHRRAGLLGALLGAALLQGVVMTAMGVAVHATILVLVSMRSVAPALTKPIIDATVHPELDAGIRATYLSLQSLAGRLAFSASLLVASWSVGDLQQLDADGLQRLSLGFAGVLVVFVFALLFARSALRGNRRSWRGSGGDL